jgi:ankyrin repeat protein
MAEQINPLHSSGTDAHGSSPLHYAVKEANLALVKFLTDNETCDLISRDIHGCTPLHYAAKEGHFDIVKVLTTSEKCDFNSQDKRRL